MSELNKCKRKTPIYVVKRIRLLEYLIDKNLFPSATKADEDNPFYQNWIYVRTPELEEALENYEPFNRSKKVKE